MSDGYDNGKMITIIYTFLWHILQFFYGGWAYVCMGICLCLLLCVGWCCLWWCVVLVWAVFLLGL